MHAQVAVIVFFKDCQTAGLIGLGACKWQFCRYFPNPGLIIILSGAQQFFVKHSFASSVMCVEIAGMRAQ